MSLSGEDEGVYRAVFLFKCPKEESFFFFFLFQLLDASCLPWLMTSLVFKSSNGVFSSPPPNVLSLLLVVRPPFPVSIYGCLKAVDNLRESSPLKICYFVL